MVLHNDTRLYLIHAYIWWKQHIQFVDKIVSIFSLFLYISSSRFFDLYTSNWITHSSLILGWVFFFQRKVNEREDDSIADSFRKLEVVMIYNVWACTSQYRSFTCIILNTYAFESLFNIYTNFSCEVKTLSYWYRFK